MSKITLKTTYTFGRNATLPTPTPVAFATMHPAESLPAQLAKISAVLASARARYLPVPENSETQRLELLVPVGQGLHAAAVLGKLRDGRYQVRFEAMVALGKWGLPVLPTFSLRPPPPRSVPRCSGLFCPGRLTASRHAGRWSDLVVMVSTPS